MAILFHILIKNLLNQLALDLLRVPNTAFPHLEFDTRVTVGFSENTDNSHARMKNKGQGASNTMGSSNVREKKKVIEGPIPFWKKNLKSRLLPPYKNVWHSTEI